MKVQLMQPASKHDQAHEDIYVVMDPYYSRKRWIGRAMWLLLAVAICCLLSAAFFLFVDRPTYSHEEREDGATASEIIGMFNDFLKRHQKSYTNDAQRTFRLAIFNANVRDMEVAQRKQRNVVFDIHPWMDQTTEELSARLMRDHGMHEIGNLSGIEVVDSLQRRYGRPESYSLRDKCTPVKDQGQCGSCWAFATVEAVETTVAIAGRPLVPLSVQEVVDCSQGSFGCQGGFPAKALLYIHQRGVVADAKYPYVAHQQGCMRRESDTAVRISDIVSIRGEETVADWIYSRGPATIVISVTKEFFAYKSGVFSPSSVDCRTHSMGYHALPIVGYGVEGGQRYWLVRNSWGPRWGDGGYIKMARGVNACGLAEHVIAPVA